MFDYVMVGTNDLEASTEFYGPIFEELGFVARSRDENIASWGLDDPRSHPLFYTGRPFDGAVATVGNGSMTAIQAPNAKSIDRLYDLAMRNGGSDEGTPGFRSQYSPTFYAAYVRDPDGNKLAFVCIDAQL